ncbi:MAG: YceI family protein [Bacteroidetes bacterium]|nr:YceI family protein [Bacteroidota bacterium]
MKTFICLAILLICQITASAQIFRGKSEATTITFFSKSPLEDITATNSKGTIMMNTTTGDVQALVTMLYFRFKKPLMEEHFNENYVESDKYPACVFKGKIADKPDLSKDGDYKVTVTGQFTLHGVTRDVSMEGTITRKGDVITISSKFKIRIADYNIRVPSLYVQNIAEVVDVTVSSEMAPFVKK